MKKVMVLSILLSSVLSQMVAKAGPGIPSSETLYSTIVVVAPTSSITEFTKDILVKSVYEEAADIVADGVITDQELDEMSVELEAKVESCLESRQKYGGEVEVLSCLEHFARFEDMVGY